MAAAVDLENPTPRATEGARSRAQVSPATEANIAAGQEIGVEVNLDDRE